MTDEKGLELVAYEVAIRCITVVTCRCNTWNVMHYTNTSLQQLISAAASTSNNSSRCTTCLHEALHRTARHSSLTAWFICRLIFCTFSASAFITCSNSCCRSSVNSSARSRAVYHTPCSAAVQDHHNSLGLATEEGRATMRGGLPVLLLHPPPITHGGHNQARCHIGLAVVS